jgi:hypothetical protein
VEDDRQAVMPNFRQLSSPGHQQLPPSWPGCRLPCCAALLSAVLLPGWSGGACNAPSQSPAASCSTPMLPAFKCATACSNPDSRAANLQGGCSGHIIKACEAMLDSLTAADCPYNSCREVSAPQSAATVERGYAAERFEQPFSLPVHLLQNSCIDRRGWAHHNCISAAGLGVYSAIGSCCCSVLGSLQRS